MTKLVWDQIGKRTYETGTDHGVLFVQDETGAHLPGVAWNGLTAVTQSPTGGEETALYADNIKYLSLFSVESFEGTIEAYTYPNEFAECDGSKEAVKGLRLGQQPRKPFSLVYRSYVGNDVIGTAAGYKIHILYNLKASPSERAYETVNETPGAITFSWGVTSTPVAIDDVNYQPTSVIEIDTTNINPLLLDKLERLLFGTDTLESKLPSPDEILEMAKEDYTADLTSVFYRFENTNNPTVFIGLNEEVEIKDIELYWIGEKIGEKITPVTTLTIDVTNQDFEDVTLTSDLVQITQEVAEESGVLFQANYAVSAAKGYNVPSSNKDLYLCYGTTNNHVSQPILPITAAF